MVGRVLGYAHEGGKTAGQDKAERQPVHQDANAPVEQVHGKGVRPLGVQQLRKGRAGRVYDVLLQVSGGEETVDVDTVYAAKDLFGQAVFGYALEVHDGNAGA